MPTLDQRILNATRPEMARTRKLIADRFVSPREWDALVREQYDSIDFQAKKAYSIGANKKANGPTARNDGAVLTEDTGISGATADDNPTRIIPAAQLQPGACAVLHSGDKSCR